MRILTLNEQLDAQGQPVGMFLNCQMRGAIASERPKSGPVEDWYFINLTGGAQPLSLHLVQFNVVSRQGQTKVLPFESNPTPGTKKFADHEDNEMMRPMIIKKIAGEIAGKQVITREGLRPGRAVVACTGGKRLRARALAGSVVRDRT